MGKCFQYINRNINKKWFSQQGFTLVEMLVTTIILSVMVAIAFFAMGLYLKGWEAYRFGDTTAIQKYRSRSLIRDALESVWEYYVTDPLNERSNVFYPFFKGDSEELIAITSSSVFHQGVPAVFRLRLISDDSNSFNLVYEESPLDNWYLRYNDDDYTYSFSMIYMPNVSKVQFRYFGYLEDRYIKESDIIERVNQWQGAFDGRYRHAVPEIIEITISDGDHRQILKFYVQANNQKKSDLYVPQF